VEDTVIEENTTNHEDTMIVEETTIVEDSAIVEKTVIKKETDIDSAVKEIVEESPTPTVVIDESSTMISKPRRRLLKPSTRSGRKATALQKL